MGKRKRPMLFWRVMAGEGSSIDDTFIDKRKAQLDAEEAARQEAMRRERQAQAESAGSMTAVQIARYLNSGKGYRLTLEPAPEGVQEMQIHALPVEDTRNEEESGIRG